MTAQAWVHRNSHTLPEHLDEALKAYRALQEQLPPKVTVHTSQVETARQVLLEMGVTDVTVEGLGGCLVCEVWLWLPESEDEEISET